jgi:hypothetical protein
MVYLKSSEETRRRIMFSEANYALLNCQLYFAHEVRGAVLWHIIWYYYELIISNAERGKMFSSSVGKKLDHRLALDL